MTNAEYARLFAQALTNLPPAMSERSIEPESMRGSGFPESIFAFQRWGLIASLGISCIAQSVSDEKAKEFVEAYIDCIVEGRSDGTGGTDIVSQHLLLTVFALYDRALREMIHFKPEKDEVVVDRLALAFAERLAESCSLAQFDKAACYVLVSPLVPRYCEIVWSVWRDLLTRHG